MRTIEDVIKHIEEKIEGCESYLDYGDNPNDNYIIWEKRAYYNILEYINQEWE